MSPVVYSCSPLHIILHLAKSRIDPALYLISMHFNALCYGACNVPKPLRDVVVWNDFM